MRSLEESKTENRVKGVGAGVGWGLGAGVNVSGEFPSGKMGDRKGYTVLWPLPPIHLLKMNYNSKL